MCIYIYVLRHEEKESPVAKQTVSPVSKHWKVLLTERGNDTFLNLPLSQLFIVDGRKFIYFQHRELIWPNEKKKKVPVKQQISRFTLLLFYKSTKPLLFSLSDLINWSFVPLYTALWEFKTTIRPEETLASENHTFYSFSTKTSTLSSEVCLPPPTPPRPPPSPIVEHFMNPTAVTVTFRTVANVLWWDDRGGSC